MVYAIYEDFFPDVEKKLNRIAKKCAKHGNPFTFEVKGEEIREKYNPENLMKEYHKFILIEVEGTAKVDNWECVAVLEFHEVGNIIRKINTEIDIPERFKHSENICEHCNSKRNRNNLYVIHNVETDEWKQVGGDCLKLYTFGLSMEYVVAFLNGITELEEYNNIVGSGKKYYSVQSILAYAVEVIAKTGYFNSNSNLPTRSLVEWLIFNHLGKAIEGMNNELARERMLVSFSAKDFFKPDTSDTVNAIIEYYKGLEDNSEFIHNVQVMLNEGYVLAKNIGYLCYLPQGYAKHIQMEIEKAKRLSEKHEHFGEVGKRYKDKAVQRVDFLTSWATEWGTTFLYKFTLENGEILVWKTSHSLFAELPDDCECDKITFTVKGHEEYRGIKQTEVTRCKLTWKVA